VGWLLWVLAAGGDSVGALLLFALTICSGGREDTRRQAARRVAAPHDKRHCVIAYKSGQADMEEKVTSGGFSSKRLTRVRDVLSRHLDAGYVPGAVAVVARHGEVHIEAMGNLAFEGAGSGTPMAADTICRIGTCRADSRSRQPPVRVKLRTPRPQETGKYSGVGEGP
jgi:hypothetical protein